MPDRSRRKALVIGVGKPNLPWWWKHVDHRALACQLDYQVIPLEGGRPKSPFTWAFVLLFVRATRLLFRVRREGYLWVFSFENDWLTFIIAGWQTLVGMRQPRHVILQFIMREKQPTLKSRLKYAFMRWCYRSVDLCVCSSRGEVAYYQRVFGWKPEKLAFVPFHTDPAFLERPELPEEGFILSAGRTFRDYPTLVAAASRGLDLPVTIVAGRNGVPLRDVPATMTVRHDLPLPELITLIGRSSIVVLPLESREISIGQSVLLEAMAMGKPVVVTSTNGSVDYVDHMRNGVLVPAADPDALREALNQLVRSQELRRRLGAAAREDVMRTYLPDHYAQGVSRTLQART